MNVVVSISVDVAPDEVAAIAAIRPITRASIADIRAALHDETPLYESELYLNNFAEVADTMRSLVTALERVGAHVLIRENDEPVGRDELWNLLEGSERYGF